MGFVRRNNGGRFKSVPVSFKEGMTAIAAWRRHLGLTQAERLGISQPAYAQQEAAERPRRRRAIGSQRP